ncbi:alpha/beta hydrolase [Dechloromonas sp. ZS-1]|uniref:alpha/beta fold hydrolase n=1 Tax=Dechloromonas sp. ZS-1 TaxID=3138067 RepID=UPI0031FBA5DA
MLTVTVQGRQLEYLRLPSAHPRPDAPPIVFLHEGLGSISMWRDFPQQVADATGCEAIVYSRYGYGRSTPRDGTPRTPRYMHDEALLALPEFLDHLAIDQYILFGHSDGGSIALLNAGQGRTRPRGIVVLAPHVMVEDITLAGIRAALQVWQTTDLKAKLAKHHRDVDSVFHAWTDIWLHPDFRNWNIEDCLPGITCPVLAIQGEDDEYATMDQIDRIAAGARDVDLVKLADCRHSPHKDQPAAVIEATRAFVARSLD